MSRIIVPWVGVDLDGTLAVYDVWKGIEHIGEPIEPIARYVRALLAMGIPVKIFTARVQEGARAIAAIEQWCLTHFGRTLPVTDRKDFGMVFCLDDRAVTVEKNTGRVLARIPAFDEILAHVDPKTPGHPDYQADGAAE